MEIKVEHDFRQSSIFCAGEAAKQCGCWCKPFICPRKRTIIFSWSWSGVEWCLSSTSRQLFAWEMLCEDETLMYLQLPKCHYVFDCISCWESLGHLGWAGTQEGNFMLCSSTLSFTLWDTFSASLYNWREAWRNMLMAAGLSTALGREDARKEREKCWTKDLWPLWLEGTSAWL